MKYESDGLMDIDVFESSMMSPASFSLPSAIPVRHVVFPPSFWG
jgi:hypothetical protein